MSTKFSLLSRAAAMAGILALSLPALAETTQPTPAAPAAPTASKQMSGDVKTDKTKVQASHKKPAKHVAHKPAAKPVVNTSTAPAASTKPDSTAPVSK
jgi:hypothetical protein